jgi:hypothetical protein
MRLRLITSAFALSLLMSPAHAQDAERLALAREFVEIQRFASSLATVSQVTMRPMLQALLAKEKGMTQKIRDEFIQRYEKKFLARAPAFADEIAAKLGQEFSSEELREAIAFSKSPTGQHLLDYQPTLMKLSSEMGSTWGVKLCQEVMREMRAEGKLK